MSGQRLGVLYEEHLALGAELGAGIAEAPAVLGYPGEPEVVPAPGGALLADLTGTAYILVSGERAGALSEAALAGGRLAVGEAAFEAVLSGDGSVIAAPLALRTGDHEYVLVDPSERGETLPAWLGFISGLDADGAAPFAGTSIEDASGMLVPLLLAGDAAREVLLDYVPGEGSLPRAGEVMAGRLDAIDVLLARVPAPCDDAYLVLVPAPSARVLWRSLLSFTQVDPVGSRRVRELLRARLPWGEALRVPGPRRMARAELEGMGLVRGDDGFVGARALPGE